jgi:hypothetical protein
MPEFLSYAPQSFILEKLYRKNRSGDVTRHHVVVMEDGPLAFNALAVPMPVGALQGVCSDKNDIGRSDL